MEQHEKAKITVFTPVYNRADTLPRLYESLKRQTDQSFVWIIVNDGSTDESEKLVKTWVTEHKLDICCIGMNFIFYYNGIMQIPLNVNANNFVMFNYQWIYYLIGGYAALNLKSLVEAGNKKKVYIGLVIILLLISSYILIDKFHVRNAVISHGWRIIYICALWFVFDVLPEIKVKSWMKNSFFLYCSHLMVLQCFQRVIDLILEKIGIAGGVLSIIEYIIVPWMIIGLLLVIAEFLKRYTPDIWKLFTGGRG